MPRDRLDSVAVAGATVTVQGEAAVRTEPDEAFVWITLTAVDGFPGPALADVAKRSEVLAILLDELEIARSDRSTTGVVVQEEFDHTSSGRRSIGHRASASVSVRISDIEVIGRAIRRASEELDARVAGPRWRVSVTNPARLEAAKRAAANAREKAAAYAAGVDAQLGPLIELSEPDDALVGQRVVEHVARTAAAVGPAMHIEAGEQEVIAAIRATFGLQRAG